MQKVLKFGVLAFVFAFAFMVAPALANPPTITIDPIADQEYVSFPQSYTITGTVFHDSATGPGVKNVCRLSAMKVLVDDGVSPTVTILDKADPVTYFGWGPTCATSASWSALWNIPAAGTYTITAKIKHVGAEGTDEEDVVITEVVVDATAPVITPTVTPAPNGAGWNNTDVTVSWLVNDPESPISSTSGCDPVTLTSETSGTTLTCTATSAGGTSSQSVTVKIDKTAPVVNLNLPADGASYTFNQTVLANWTATDATSGIDTAVGTTASGVAISTAPIGAKSYTVTATDLAGNSTTVTNNYSVLPYNFRNFLAPLSIDSKTFKKTSTIPVKFQITNVDGSFNGNATAQLWLDGALIPAVSSGSSNVSNFFRYDLTGNLYIFNLSTKMPVLTIGTHTLKVTLDDGTSYTKLITIK